MEEIELVMPVHQYAKRMGVANPRPTHYEARRFARMSTVLPRMSDFAVCRLGRYAAGFARDEERRPGMALVDYAARRDELASRLSQT